MGNLVTLSSTTLISPLGREDGEAYVASVAGLSDGTRLYIDRESVAVIGNPLANPVRLRRGQDGTGAELHPNGATAWIAQPDPLSSRAPAGLPPRGRVGSLGGNGGVGEGGGRMEGRDGRRRQPLGGRRAQAVRGQAPEREGARRGASSGRGSVRASARDPGAAEDKAEG